MIADYDRDIMRVLMRSEDLGAGWRQVSDVVWPLIERFGDKNLIEIDDAQKRVRLSPDGLVVAHYLL